MLNAVASSGLTRMSWKLDSGSAWTVNWLTGAELSIWHGLVSCCVDVTSVTRDTRKSKHGRLPPRVLRSSLEILWGLTCFGHTSLWMSASCLNYVMPHAEGLQNSER